MSFAFTTIEASAFAITSIVTSPESAPPPVVPAPAITCRVFITAPAAATFVESVTSASASMASSFVLSAALIEPWYVADAAPSGTASGTQRACVPL